MTLEQLYTAIRKSNYCEFLVCLEINYPKYNETRHLIELLDTDVLGRYIV